MTGEAFASTARLGGVESLAYLNDPLGDDRYAAFHDEVRRYVDELDAELSGER